MGWLYSHEDTRHMKTANPPRRIHISRNVGKLGNNIPCVNLPVGLSCRQDAPCAQKCYARRHFLSTKRCTTLHQRNYDIWLHDPVFYQDSVIHQIAGTGFFRWHSAGDIPSAAYLEMMVQVANRLPHTRFLAFSKQHEIINAFLEGNLLPENLTIVLSAWGEWAPINPNGLPTAHIRFRKQESHIPKNARHCPGYCGECVVSTGSCWTMKPGDAVYFNEH